MKRRLSDAKLEVMERLRVARRPLTDSEVAARVWSLAKVKNTLSRILVKRTVEPIEDGRRCLYSPAVQRELHVTDESRRLVGRSFGSKLSTLFACLAEDEAPRDEKIIRTEAMLGELRK